MVTASRMQNMVEFHLVLGVVKKSFYPVVGVANKSFYPVFGAASGMDKKGGWWCLRGWISEQKLIKGLLDQMA
jgi:hypothetical protein